MIYCHCIFPLNFLRNRHIFEPEVSGINDSSFRRVQNVVCFLLGDSPASDLYMPTFRNTLSVPSSKADRVFRNVGIYKSDAGEENKLQVV